MPFLALGILGGMGCGTTEPNGGVVSLAVSPDPVVLQQGDSTQLSVSALDGQGRLVTGVPVTFASGDTSIAVVSNVGRVKSRGPKGSTSVAVSGGGVMKSVPVQIVAPPASIELQPTDTTVLLEDSVRLTATVRDSTGTPVPGFPVRKSVV